VYLKRLTLRGFKSFASATSMTFEPGITCIVGPNGSGKSNVVDALAWVMGEQGAKSLRGGSMEDVIFAGTSTRAPLGRAEIQLTIDNSDHALPIEYAEVTISRTKFRNGNSEYAINGTACRLLDVRELLSDSGIGKEMHVVVGQGELDEILSATPELRRNLVEEAAGVLKHRERKEKALRKLEATEVNLNRLTDLIAEIRRQLRPLGRQAEVAKRASVVQAELLDARARLLADDLVQAHAGLAAETADEEAVRARRRHVESDLATARLAEDEARTQMAATESAYRMTQQTWFALSGVTERVKSVVALAGERVRYAEQLPAGVENPARDPDTLEAQAAVLAAEEETLRAELSQRAADLEAAGAVRGQAEAAEAEADRVFQAEVQSSARQRESQARVAGQVSALNGSVEAAKKRLEQLGRARDEAETKLGAARVLAAQAQSAAQTHGRDQAGLEAAEAAARETATAAESELEAARSRDRAEAESRSGLAARIEALRLALSAGGDGAAWITSEAGIAGLLGPVASLVQVEPGYEKAVAAALGAVAQAVAVPRLADGIDALGRLRERDKGRAGLLIASGTAGDLPPVPAGAGRALSSVLRGDAAVVSGLNRATGPVLIVESLREAQGVLGSYPDIKVVTREGDVLSSWFVTGGTAEGESAIQLASALAAAEAELTRAESAATISAAALARAQERVTQAQAQVGQAGEALARWRRVAGELSGALARAEHQVALAQADCDGLSAQLARAGQQQAGDISALAKLRDGLAAVPDATAAPDPAHRDELAAAARDARALEMEARLALRTGEERLRSLTDQAASVRQMAQAERAARVEAAVRRAQAERQARIGQTVAEAGSWLLRRVMASMELAQRQRDQAGQDRSSAEAAAENSRRHARDLTVELEALVDSLHREELARTQRAMRIDALAQQAMNEVGLDAETLMSQYGPDQPVPVVVPGTLDIAGDEAADDEPATVPYVREEQLKRARNAERDLQVLGKINPLALEEFDAMQERHRFLAAQLEDVKQTRADLLRIVEEVDARVQEVFAAAYADVEREFAIVFARLFPGGSGRLVLTEPGQWLTTGVEVEARPAGKNVKRLSLLSGGERSLVAVCFLLALFQARPSPFYVLDEVEAALDDTNLGRLLEIYDELRARSQLLVITHQKRTMEIADTLYGVTMGSDGTSTVVSQRLREDGS